MKQARTVERVITPQPVIEGAGVRLKRSIATPTLDYVDPFLLFDHFGSDDPEDYLAGFPWHPHRGIETVTYMLAGEVDHRDSIGNAGRIGAGDVQWMTAGSGIVHHEMPQGDAQGRMHGFQLWANLPSALKMTAPRYQDVQSKEIAEIVDDDGTTVRVICGEFWGKRGPVDGIAADPCYLDVFVPAGKKKSLPVNAYRSTFAYIFEGTGTFRHASDPMGILTERTAGNDDDLVRDMSGNRSLVLFDSGDEVVVRAGEQGIRFLLVSGAPIKEPVAWYGPIVMNTQAELQVAMRELQAGTFIKH